MAHGYYAPGSLNVRSYEARAAIDARYFDDPLPFYCRAACAEGGPVLELGCGTGRITRAVAAAGVAAVGLDLSAGMLAEARRLAPAITWVEGDMADFALGRRFAQIFIPFRGLMELTEAAAQAACLAAAYRHLRPGGRLILDLLTPDPRDCLPEGDDAPVDLPPVWIDDGTTMVQITIGARRNDPLTQILSEQWYFSAYDPAGRLLAAEQTEHRLRWIHGAEARLMLQAAGFVVEEHLGGFDGAPPALDRDQVWIARRR